MVEIDEVEISLSLTTFFPNPMTAITNAVNSSYCTRVTNASAAYYASIVSGSCESSRTPILSDIKNVPAAPTATGATGCLSWRFRHP
jgi:hypothetical protein